MIIDPYSPLLVFALFSLAIAVVAIVAHRVRPGLLPRWLPWLAITIVLLGVILALVSHALLGHRRGTTDALGLVDFVVAHPAPLLIGSLALVLIALSR